MIGLLKKLFDPNPKELQRLRDLVVEINEYEPELARLSDAELRAKTGEFRQRLDNGATLDDLLPEAFAVVREAAKRTVGMRHFDVQLMGGIVLHEGRIAEMKTGEGKTLVATAPLYLNALAGKGVHLVTVNDYLARRDAEWMGPIYKFLGMSVGVIVHGKDFAERRRAYAADITYGTNNEFGFDYLRDNMVRHRDQMVQRELYYAIVDEVDSILIDEARTPLIISGPAEQSTEHYYRFARLVPKLQRDVHYTVDEKARTVALTDEGVAKVEELLGIDNLNDDAHFHLNHYLIQALKAHTLFHRDRDYVVKDGQVIIVDEFTGRLMFGRRYSDGLHQAIEAKEGVKIERESQTLATITFQNYFRMYKKLAGMTGTAKTEEEEFRSIYGMDVVEIPTNKPMIRVDYPDVVYKTEAAKFRAVVDEIEECHRRGQPVLVGTVSIEKSERLSAMLKQRGIPHQVLNAKYHEKEAEIIAQAGKKGAVTIATNMAGRGTDIVLGGNPAFKAREEMRRRGYSDEEIAVAAEPYGNDADLSPRLQEARRVYREILEEMRQAMAAEHDEVVALGGLHIIGTERHESRRIDNQLRGRAGRQGDPGSSRFYVSLEDDLMRLFGSERIAGLMERLGWTDDQPIEHNQVTRAIENAQKKVEARNFELRKQVLQFDDVMNKQREVIYDQRRRVLLGENLRDSIVEMMRRLVGEYVDTYCAEKVPVDEWDLEALVERVQDLANRQLTVTAAELEGLDRPALRSKLEEALVAAYAAREQEFGPLARDIERHHLLQFIDSKWMEHLRAMDDLREGISLRAYGQKNPLLEYQFEAYEMFQNMLRAVQEDTVKALFRTRVVVDGPPRQQPGTDLLSRAAYHGAGDAPGAQRRRAPRRVEAKVGRNDPCPCGSGKKYKKCCGAA
ncbi:MAG TPA: preprotein translocase subunit SecA [Limnochordales bacterium]|nr:preprotein translocase subunit SecA [Limnochordales bacterium]